MTRKSQHLESLKNRYYFKIEKLKFMLLKPQNTLAQNTIIPMNMKQLRNLLAFISFILPIEVFAQCDIPGNYCQSDTLIYSCAGNIYDSGGDNIYQSTASQLTICPSLEGYRSRITFTTFDLFPGDELASAHTLYIFDGTDTGDPIIGEYTGNSLQGVTIVASNLNESGCLMLLFPEPFMENTLNSGWTGIIGCDEPCAEPTIVFSINAISTDQNLFHFCPGSLVQIDASTSSAAPGHTIAGYAFNFDDGTAEIYESQGEHSYVLPHIYEATLTITDEINCAADTIIPIAIQDDAEINLPQVLGLCPGADSALVATYTAQSISNANMSANTNSLFIVDGAGFDLTSSVLISGYPEGSLIENCDDFNSVFVNMEHSYMGDLSIALECPNGTIVNMLTFPSGGGGTFVGQALDEETTEPGIGWDYVWTPEASNGTWGQNVLTNSVAVTMPTPGNSLASGTYSSQEDLCNFLGCPLNGVWTLIVTDNLGADNGYLFNWGLELAGTQSENVYVEYTPQISNDFAHSFWSGDDLLSLSLNGDTAIINTAEISTLNLSFQTIDNLGCSTTENTTIEVFNYPIDIITPDYTYDPSSAPALPIFYGQATGLGFNSTFEWSYWPPDGIEAIGSVFYLDIPNDNSFYVLTAENDLYPGCSDTDTVNVFLPEIQIGGYIFFDANLNGIMDSTEVGMPNFPFTIANNGTNSFSTATGQYFAFPNYSGNSITILIDTTLWIPTTDITYTFDLTQGNTFTYNFGVYQASNEVTDVAGFISVPSTLCILNNTQHLSIVNQGNTMPSGYAVYTFDTLCTFVNSVPAVDSISGNQLFYNFGPLNYNANYPIHVTLDMPNTGMPGDSLWFTFQVYHSVSSDSMAVFMDGITTPILCSYDPNDIRELNGIGPDGRIAPNTTLDYVIRFENLGTATAYDVVIIDELPEELDPLSLQPIAASHPYQIIIEQGTLIVDFNDINLPQANEDSLLNKGYIHFRIDQIPDLPVGTQFTNSAAIYFDYNPPIYTNHALSTIFECPQTSLYVNASDAQLEILDNVSNITWYINGVATGETGNAITPSETGSYQAQATTSDGCTLLSNLYDFTVNSISQTIRRKPLIFPNPSNHVAYLQASVDWVGSNYEIYSASGVLMHSGILKSLNTEIPSTDWASGLYAIRINSSVITDTLLYIKQ